MIERFGERGGAGNIVRELVQPLMPIKSNSEMIINEYNVKSMNNRVSFVTGGS
jgi:hypothetical protein